MLPLPICIQALERIRDNKIHHDRCYVDHCVPACPVRLADQALNDIDPVFRAFKEDGIIE